jgi:hypothetical protein
MIDRDKIAQAANLAANECNSPLYFGSGFEKGVEWALLQITNNNSKTAIDWLIKELDNVKRTSIEYWEAIDKAKEIEKKQIIKAMLDGSYGNPLMTKEIAEKYYEETYKK